MIKALQEQEGHLQEPFRKVRQVVVSYENRRNLKNLPLYEKHAEVLGQIRTLLEDRYDSSFTLYLSNDGVEDYWNLLEEDIQSGSAEVEHVCEIYDLVEARAFEYRGDREGAQAPYQLFPSIRNNVFIYPQWGVALARVPIFRPHGTCTEDFVFAKGDKELLAFLAHTTECRRTRNRRRVTLFTDTSNGLMRETQTLTRMVEREEVVMEEELKKEIYRSIDHFFGADRGFFKTFDLPYKRGILLYGKPGNGKTTLVKSIAGSIQAPVAYWQITEFTNSESIQEVFEASVQMAPMVLVIEDIDSMPERARSFFLNTLDGATSKEGIFLIGTSNYPEKIDPALMNRAGRFDRAYEVKLPNLEQRRYYLERKKLKGLLGGDGFEEIVRGTDGFTFAQLNELYVSAALEWYETKQVDGALLINKMKAELDKSRHQVWIKEATGPAVGFLA